MGGLKPSVIFTPDPASPQLVDTSTRRGLRLTPAEARVLQKFDGSQTSKELALWAANEGLAIGPVQVQVMLERLEHAGYLLSAPHIPPQDLRDVGFGPGDDPLKAEHIVPSMRSDLKIVPTGSRVTFQVSDPGAHRAFTLYDFEVSIARMLDGRRTAAQVVEAAAKIGITVTLDGLRRFMLQLKAFKFLSAEPADIKRGPQSTWPMRAEWTEDLRQLYQNALRQLRSNRLKEAREYLLAMLEIDPMNREAQETKARVDELVRDPITELTFGELHREPVSSTGPLLDSVLRVPVALGPTDALGPIEPPAPLPVGARPTAPALKAVVLVDEPPPHVEHLAVDVEVEPVSQVGLDEPAVQVDEPAVHFEPVDPPAPPVLLPTPEPAPAPEPVVAPAPSAPDRVMGDSIFSPPPSPAKPSSGFSADELAAALPGPSVFVDELPPDPPPALPPPDIVPQSLISPPVGLPAAQPLEAAEEPAEERPKRKGGARRVVLVLMLLVVAGLLAVPLPRTQTVPCELLPLKVATVVTPRPGTIDELPVKDGDVVEKGQLLATLSAKETQTQLERLRARATAMEQQLDKLAKSVQPAEVEKAKAALAEKTKELNQATEHKRRLEAKHAPAGQLAKAEKDLRAKQKDADKATEELDKVSHESKLSSGRLVVEGLKRQTAQLEEELAAARIVAPEAGRLEGLVAPGATLAEHAEVARIVAPGTLSLVAREPGISTSIDPTGSTVSTGGGPGVLISDIQWVKDTPNPRLTGTLGAPGFKPGPATITVPLGKRSWGLELFERAEAMIRHLK